MATFIVSNTNDSGAGSLRQAIADANTQAGNDAIEFDAALTGSLIRLTTGKLVLNSNVAIDGDINNDGIADITITGDANGDDTLQAGTNLTDVNYNANRVDNSQILEITTGTVSLDGLKITGGNSSAGNGGGISSAAASVLTITNSTLSGNYAYSGGAISNSGTTTISNSTLSGNSAYNGGAVGNDGTIYITNSTLSRSSAFLSGGGIRNTGTATLTNSSLFGNSAGYNGGGIFNSGTFTLISSTISGNEGGIRAGGIDNAGNLALANSIVLGNIAPAGSDINLFSGTVTGDNNISTGTITGSNNNTTATAADVFASVSGGAGELADNGGLVQTIAIKSGGAAHNTGNNAALPSDAQDVDGDGDTAETLPTDGRGPGNNRIEGGTVDIGAFELLPNLTLIGDQNNNSLSGKTGNDTIVGKQGDDDLSGGLGDDVLRGGKQKDQLRGEAGEDFLRGGFGKDKYWGGADMDVFDFDKVKHIGRKVGKRDVIKDWEDGVDKIDFSDIDAIEGGTDDAFTFIGKAEFTGTAGELLYKHTAGGHTVIKGDTDGDGKSDFALRLKGIHDLDADDFIL